MARNRIAKLLGALTLIALLASFNPAKAQQLGPGPQNNSSPLHLMGASMYYAPAYNTYSAAVLNTLSGTGSQTYIVGPPTSLRDGTSFAYNPAVLFNTNVPLTFGDANSEIVTPTAVSIGPCPTSVTTGGPSGGAICVSITATFSNAHGQGTRVFSGDNGIMEAVTDAGNNGGGFVYWVVDTGIVTLNTGSTTTTTTTKVPSTYISMTGAGRVTTTITTSTSWAVGTAANTTDFCTAQTTLTAGTVCNVVALTSPTYRGTGAISLTAIVFTMGTSAPGAGAIKARVWGYTPVQSSQ